MTTGSAIHPSLIAGHIAVAALALAATRLAPAIVMVPEWHEAGRLGPSLSQSPRRLPMPRRTDRPFAITLLD